MRRLHAVLGTALLLIGTTGVGTVSAADAVTELRRQVPPALKGTCARLKLGESDVRVAGATGALVCIPGGPVEDVGFYRFEGSFDLGYWWKERMGMLDHPLGAGDCSAGVAGVELTPAGRVACYRTRGVARIRWFDEQRLLYGSVDGTDRSIEGLFAWWVENIAGSDAPNEALLAPSAGPLVTWQRVQTAPRMGLAAWFAPPGASANAVATSARGDSVVVGDELETPLAWHSDDGLAWREVAMPGSQYGCRTCTPSAPGDPGTPVDVVAFEDGFVAIGNTVDEPPLGSADAGRAYGLVWTSDDGMRWSNPQEIPDARFGRLAVMPEGLAIVGLADPKLKWHWRGHPTIWTSIDATDWNPQPIGERRGRALELARSPSGVSLARASELWRSTAESSWVELALPREDAESRGLRFAGPVWTPTGFVLAVTTAEKVDGRWHSELWHSEDGLTWTVVAVANSPLHALASGPSGSYAFTMPPDKLNGDLRLAPPTVLSSEDGRSWCRTEHEAFRLAAVRDADVGPDGRVLGVGLSDHADGAALIWRGIPANVDRTACRPALALSEEPRSISLTAVAP